MSVPGAEQAATAGPVTAGREPDGPAPAGPGLVVGRRAVVDGQLAVHGYRLAVAGPPAGTLSEEIAGRVAEDGALAGVFGTRPAFVAPDRPYLVGARGLPELPERTVIEVAAGAAGDSEVVDGCRRLVAAGRLLAVTWDGDPATGDVPPGGPLLDMAHYVGLDPAGRDEEELRRWAGQLAGRPGRQLIARNVDSPAQLRAGRQAGFDLFEGRLLSHPVAVVSEALTPSRLACLQMLEKVNDPETSAADLEKVVETDPGLSYRLLHVSGLGAAGGLRRQVRSIREATVLLGREWIYRWLILMVVADANQGTPEQMTIAMTRARMCELLAGTVSPAERDSAFTVGLVSALDLLLGSSLADVVSKLAITTELKQALLARTGRLGAILTDVVDWELGTPGPTLRTGVDHLVAERCYLEALSWACGLDSALAAAA